MLGILFLAFVVMLALKLLGFVAISWLLVCLPLIVLAIYGVAFFVVVFVLLLIGAVLGL